MKKKYKKLSLFEREVLAIGMAKGKSLRAIAKELGRHHSTLSRELKNHHPPRVKATYSPCASHDIARIFRRRAGRKRSMDNEDLRQYVETKIKIGWSPEQISGRVAKDHPGLSVSHETIYQYVYEEADYLVGYLAKRHKFRRKKRSYRREKRSPIPNRISIDKRPEVINTRKVFGHWESDSIVSSKSVGALNVLLERKSRKVMITQVHNKKSLATAEAITDRMMWLPSGARKSITYDNGFENRLHERVNLDLQMRSFFCSPYHSWEKGSVENINGLIRRYIPKRTDLDRLTGDQIRYIENQLNNRPRKCLGYRTPNEAFNHFLSGGALET